ncbi:Sulfur carrier protein FdhD [hydrothermal vent metagenome]|uniref:Sulfur carrier protein FdhD n=1 Tax=hydrothermal vent metagenome TaxID=652676 RepID=A0A3B0UXZ7_9ZZZZ
MMIKIIQEYRLSNNKIQKLEIYKLNKNTVQQTDDYTAIEAPLEIRLGHDADSFQTLAVTMCSPSDIAELVTGYLFTENIIQRVSDILKIDVCNNELGIISEVILAKSICYDKFLNKRHGMIHASCGICGKTEFDDLLTYNYPAIIPSNNTYAADVILSLPQKLHKQQQAFLQTGGLHASALFSLAGDIILIKEDIGRHNALDKLIGAAIKQNLVPLSDYIILLSGRVSFELVHKSLMAGARILAAIGAPSSLSIEIAKVNDMTLLGFIKTAEYNIYS